MEGVLKEAGLSKDAGASLNKTPTLNGAAAYAALIANKSLEDDGRYFILSVIGQVHAHAIGLYRGVLGDVSVFDPNVVKYTCANDATDVAAAILAIFQQPFYAAALNDSWSWSSFK